MAKRIEALLLGPVKDLTDTLERICGQIDPAAASDDDAIAAEVSAAITTCLDACSQLEEELIDDTPLLRSAQEQFRAAIQPWFQQSWFMQHALTKPRGYAGDYHMLTRVYDRQVMSRGLGGYLDRYFLNTELGRSISFRLQMARQFLIEEALRRREMSVLNIASGPGREYVGGFDLPDDCRLQVACVDQDDEALDFVRQKVVPTLPHSVELECVKYNALKMGNADLNIEHFGRRDVIYSVGLCDYIPDRLMIRLLRGWRESVADGGVVYVAFKDCRRYDKTKYQWLVDWYFYQRTEEECRDLFAQAGYAVDEMQMTRDETGSIINFISRHSATTTTRIDSEGAAHEPVSIDSPVHASNTVSQ